MSSDPLFTPLEIGPLDLPHRIVMAPLTRSRCTVPDDVPNEMMERYYVQRASAALIISEPLWLEPRGRGYALTPGLITHRQVAGWRRITDAVHAAGGRIAAQLWHVGRVSHSFLLPKGEAPVAPSALRADTKVYVDEVATMVPASDPRALAEAEIEALIRSFAEGACRAREAGFDAVELHGASGYLLDQFTRSGSNRRQDAWGGDLERRLRFPVAVAQAVAAEIGSHRVGYRVQPFGTFNAMSDEAPEETFPALAARLGELGLGWLHAIEAEKERGPQNEQMAARIQTAFRSAGGVAYMGNGGYDGTSARAKLAAGEADLVSFGIPYIANPDLAERLRDDAPWNEADPATFYCGGARGYVDYPTLAGS